jgi:heterotetrameric sarcosine oxidase gamma subunit
MKLHSRAVLGATFGVSAAVPAFDGGAANMQLLERADVGCVLVASTIDPAAAVSELNAAARLEFPLAAGATTKSHLHRVLWLTPRSWLIHCPVDEERALAGRINHAFTDKRVYAAPYTDHLCWLELSGSQALNCLTEGGFVSLERDGIAIGHAKRGLLASIAIVIVHEDLHTWLLGVERSRTIYFVEWLCAVGRRQEQLVRRL